jgi:LacI family transcriptional regulator
MKTAPVTIKDIARYLNISPSTVSRALKDNPEISQETRQQVVDLAAQLEYRPNIVARGLKKRQSATIGVIIPEIVHYFFSQVISGIEEVAYNEGYTVMICQSNEKSDREANNVHTLLAHQVAGILVSVSKETAGYNHLEEVKKNGVPLVFFDRSVPGMMMDQVINDNRESAYRVTQHLIQEGCTRIVHFAGPQNLSIGRERKEGYLQALSDAGIAFREEWCTAVDSFDKAYREVMRLHHAGRLPDALFCNNDLTALGAMKALRELNVAIPGRVAVAGFSNGIFSEISDPSLTTVDQHGYEMGAEATRLLLKRINSQKEGEPPVTRVVRGDLIIRNTSGKVAF